MSGSNIAEILYTFSVYIFISSRKVAGDAPDGTENWFVMINTPENVGQNWNSLVKQARNNIIQKINRMLAMDISSLIVSEERPDPVRIEANTTSWKGSLYGTHSSLAVAAFLRHPNRCRIKGLYFCGESVHPGGGLPLCLSLAKIVSEMVD